MSYTMKPLLLKNICVQGRNFFYSSMVQTKFQIPIVSVVGQHRFFSTLKSTKHENTILSKSETLVPKSLYTLQPVWCHNFHSSAPQNNQFNLKKVQSKLVSKFNELQNALLKDLKEIKSAPQPAMMLGGALVAPFLLLPIVATNTGSAELAYGACMLAFFGGVRWGSTLPNPSDKMLGPSVGPALLGCLGMALPQTLGGLVVISGLLSSTYYDIITAGYPPWLKGLRSLITLVGGSMILLTSVF